MIRITILGDPVAQGRARATTVNGHVRMYDPAKSRSYKDYVKFVASDHVPDKLIEGKPIALTVDVYRSIPKSMSKKKREMAENGQIRPITKPDADNYLKIVKDALNGIIWKDDSIVVDCHVRKFYSDKPRIEIRVEELDA